MAKKSYLKSVVEIPQSDFSLFARVAQVLDARQEHPQTLIRLNADCYEAASRADPNIRVDDDGAVWAHERALFAYMNTVCQNVK